MSWSQVLRLPGKEVTNLSYLTSDGKGIRELQRATKGQTLFTSVQPSPHMNSASILSQPGPVCSPVLAEPSSPTATALAAGGRVQGVLGPGPAALTLPSPVTCRLGLQEICICRKGSATKISLNSPAIGDGPALLPAQLPVLTLPNAGPSRSPSHIQPAEAGETHLP